MLRPVERGEGFPFGKKSKRMDTRREYFTGGLIQSNESFSYGIESFIKTAVEVGIDGLILPDVPLEEKEEFHMVCKKYQIIFLSFTAPTSKERIKRIAKEAEGFMCKK